MRVSEILVEAFRAMAPTERGRLGEARVTDPLPPKVRRVTLVIWTLLAALLESVSCSDAVRLVPLEV